MKGRNWFAATAGMLIVLAPMPDSAQESLLQLYGPITVVPGLGMVARPASSIRNPGVFHTHLQILISEREGTAPPRSGGAVPQANSWGQTPASLACVYNLVPQSNGCNPYAFFTVASGGSKTNPIVIVDAFSNPTVKGDLAYFSQYFGLPMPSIKVYYCNQSSCGSKVTTPPRANAGWALEQALDVQAAHSMAPKAPIILVEAYSNSFGDLLRAESYAASLVASAGGGEVTNSWGSEEFPDEINYDSTFEPFMTSNVTFFASAGDGPGVEWPSSSPYVVGVGGTTIVLNGSYQFQYQSTWATNQSEAGGGGISAYEGIPGYQSAATSVASQLGGFRGVPDISADANPLSGLWVYCSPRSCGVRSPWVQVGGTSLSSPLLAGLTNNAINVSNPPPSSTALLTQIYANLDNANKYYQVTNADPENSSAYCYNNSEDGAVTTLPSAWNVCTGAGTPQGAGGL